MEPEDDSQEWVYNKFAGVTSHSSDESAMSGEQTGSSAPLPGASPVLTRISHTLRSTKRMVDKASMWWGFKFTQGDGCLLQGGSQLATSEAIARIVFAVPRCVSKAMAGKVDFAKNFVCGINKDRFHHVAQGEGATQFLTNDPTVTFPSHRNRANRAMGPRATSHKTAGAAGTHDIAQARARAPHAPNPRIPDPLATPLLLFHVMFLEIC